MLRKPGPQVATELTCVGEHLLFSYSCVQEIKINVASAKPVVEEASCVGSWGAGQVAEAAFLVNWKKRNTSVELSRVKSRSREPLSCECTSTLQGTEG